MRYVIILILFCRCFMQEVVYIDPTKVRDPKIAWKLSVVPGFGQMYNGEYIKALGFISAEYYAINNFIDYNSKKNKIELRNTYAWWVLGLFVWNMLDAYVDAHLSTFPIKKLESNVNSDSLKIGKKL